MGRSVGPEEPVRRRQVRWYTFRFPDKRRPVVILTRDPVAARLERVTVAPVTTTIRGIRSEVLLDEADGMRERCAINFDGLHTVEANRLGAVITFLRPERDPDLESAALYALGFRA